MEIPKIVKLANRLAESVLMDWDKEEQVRLAKEVAIKCHSIFNDKESREFVSLVKMMRDAQKLCDTMASKIENETQRAEQLWEIMNDSINLESEVDEYLNMIEV